MSTSPDDLAAALDAAAPPEKIRKERAPKAPTEAEALGALAVHLGKTMPPSEVPATDERVTVGTGQMAQLVATIERLFDRVDQGDRQAQDILQGVLAQNAALLKQTLAPENRLHPDISDLNPLGERDHPRPQLKRPCYFLGVPLEQPALSRDEIALLNSVTRPLELKERKWRVAFLRDGSGGEALYISVPFNSFDDLRALPPDAWQSVVRACLGEGTAPVNQDSLLERIQQMEQMIRTQQDALASLTQTPPPAR